MLEEMSLGPESAWDFYSYLTFGSHDEEFPIKVGSYDPASTKGGNDLEIQNYMKFTTYDNEATVP